MNEPQRFRKKPGVIEAQQFDGTEANGLAICRWASENGAQAEYHPYLADHFDPKEYVTHPDPYLRVVTLEGTMVASKGDWVIRGVKGGFYPVKDPVFQETYEAVDDACFTPIRNMLDEIGGGRAVSGSTEAAREDEHYVVQVTNMPPTELICKCGTVVQGSVNRDPLDLIKEMKEHITNGNLDD